MHVSDGRSWNANLCIFIMPGLLTPGRQRAPQPEQTCYPGHSLLHKANDYIWHTEHLKSTTSFIYGRLVKVFRCFFVFLKTNLVCVFSPLLGHSGRHHLQHRHCNRKNRVWDGWYKQYQISQYSSLNNTTSITWWHIWVSFSLCLSCYDYQVASSLNTPV